MPTQKVVETTVYKYAELSDSAKDNARDWYREMACQDFGDFDADYVLDDSARLFKLIGLNIETRAYKTMGGQTKYKPNVYYSGFSSQGDGATFAGSYAYVKGGTKALSQEAPEGPSDSGHRGNNEVNAIARELASVQRRNFYRIQANVSHGGHSMFISDSDIDVERADDVQMSDEDIETVRECMRDFANYIYRSLEREYEYRQSDDVVAENIEANDYEFDEDGNRA